MVNGAKKMIQKSEMGFLEELIGISDRNEDTEENVRNLAEKHGLRPYEAESIWSFYRQDTSKMKICRGLPCRLKAGKSGTEELGNYVDEETEIVSCLGYCEHAPVAWSKGKYYQIDGANTRELALGESYSGFEKAGSLQDYLDKGGFNSLLALLENSSENSIVEFVNSLSLKGFGGSGFPAYVKWKAVSASEEKEKFLLVNAHEGEPGTFKDRVLMESNPYGLLEAALVAALSVGATGIIIALKHEYLEAEKSLKRAWESSQEYLEGKADETKLPGLRILRIPGYYITGEESALMEAVEGRRSEPRLRPPYPAEVGLFGKPTLIDNVETLLYFLDGLREHERTCNITKGKKAYCLTGDVEHPGPYFLPYGTSSSTLLTDIGGTGMYELKAVLPGGLSGGIIPSEKANINLDFDSVKEAGAGLGTGSMIAISKDRCMVDMLENIESFFERESCGKCMPCRYGTTDLKGLFTNLKHGKATLEDLKGAEETADVMLKGSICGLGQASARMFMDAIRHFRGEIEEHIGGKCPANLCFREAQ